MSGVWLSHPVFQVPLSDADLQILGRITVMWGHIETNVELLLIVLGGEGYGFAAYDAEFGKQAIGGKIRALKDRRERSRDPDSRDRLDAFVKAAFAVLDDRNAVAHGLWGWHQRPDGHFPVAHHRNRAKLFSSSDLPALHERLVNVCVKAEEAFHTETGIFPLPIARNRPYIVTDGEEVRPPG